MADDPVELRVGDAIPPFSRVGDLHNWNRYAAVNEEFVDIHMDDDAGRAAGYPGAFGMGNLTFAWVHAMLRAWLPGDGRIVACTGRFRGVVGRGDIVTCAATITRIEPGGGRRLVALDVTVTNQRSEDVMTGTATVEVGA